MKTITDPKKIKELLERGVGEVIIREHLEKRLMNGEKLRVKFGIDPTAPDLHLGHTVPLRKLRQFQEIGHQIVLIVGDFTATIGDPSGRSETRKPLSDKEVKENMKNYLAQASKVINMAKTEVYYNSEWFGKGGAALIYDLSSKVTVQRVLERDDFKKRLAQDQDVTIVEMLYPLFQGYDSVMVKADVEVGGTDQKFNLLMGRRIQRRFGQPEQDILTTWLLEGTDGTRKMSKSLGNYIGLSEPATEMYAEIMSIPDELIVKYFSVLTEVSQEEVDKMLELSRRPDFGGENPRDLKAKLAGTIVEMYHGKEAAEKAEAKFNLVFQKKGIPTDIPVLKIKIEQIPLLDILVQAKMASSKAAAKRLIIQGGVKINGIVEKDWQKIIKVVSGTVIQVGKRKFIKLEREL
jgi:tyrosyl-tRNA synthetase